MKGKKKDYNSGVTQPVLFEPRPTIHPSAGTFTMVLMVPIKPIRDSIQSTSAAIKRLIEVWEKLPTDGPDGGEQKAINNNTLQRLTLAYRDLKRMGNEYEQYEAKARLNLINQIYQSHDNNLNEKYKVELNQRTIERVKNSF